MTPGDPPRAGHRPPDPGIDDDREEERPIGDPVEDEDIVDDDDDEDDDDERIETMPAVGARSR